jgi:predicted Zn finger-like uncharacterized protein
MLIQCPKCRAVYNLSEGTVPDQGLKMRCAKCHEIWTAYPDAALSEAEDQTKTDALKKLFAEQVSPETQSLFEPKEPRVVEKIQVVQVTRHKQTFNLIMFVVAVLSVIGILYGMRYDIVRRLPEMEKFYNYLQWDSIPYGKDLEFHNVEINEVPNEDNISIMQIRGILLNKGHYQTIVPPLQIEIADKDKKTLANVRYYLSLPRLEAGYRLLFNIPLVNPTAFGKSVYIRFADEDLYNQDFEKAKQGE